MAVFCKNYDKESLENPGELQDFILTLRKKRRKDTLLLLLNWTKYIKY